MKPDSPLTPATLAAKKAIYRGDLVECTKTEYITEVREFLQTTAGEYIDRQDHLRGMICLNEVKRLDEFFNYRNLV